MLPRLMLGTSPFIGAGQFGPKSMEYKRTFYDNPKNMERLFVTASQSGINAVQLIAYGPLIEALHNVQKQVGKFYTAVTIVEDFLKDLEKVSVLEPDYIAPHAMFCDKFDSRLPFWIDKIKETGAKPAASTHNPGLTIPRLEDSGIEIFLAPLNPLGYMMKPDFESTLNAMKKTAKKIIAIKPLAAGKLEPEQTLFQFIFKYADSMAVGMTSEWEMEEILAVLKELED